MPQGTVKWFDEENGFGWFLPILDIFVVCGQP
jgi:cold shock CspA family protein